MEQNLEMLSKKYGDSGCYKKQALLIRCTIEN